MPTHIVNVKISQDLFFPHTPVLGILIWFIKSHGMWLQRKNWFMVKKNPRDWYLSEMFKLCLLGWGSGFSGMECHRTQPAQTNDGLTPTFLPCSTVLPTPVLDAQFSFWQTDGRSCSCWQQPQTLAAAVDHDEPVSTSKRTPSLQFIFKSDFIAQTLWTGDTRKMFGQVPQGVTAPLGIKTELLQFCRWDFFLFCCSPWFSMSDSLNDSHTQTKCPLINAFVF